MSDSSPSVTIKVFGGLRTQLPAGAISHPVTGSDTLGSLIDRMAEQHPDLVSALKKGLDEGYLQILVNGRNARFLNMFDTRLRDGDRVAFLPPVGGG